MLENKFHTPYYAVIFTSTLEENPHGYEETAIKMETLAKKQKGFLGMDSVRSDIGITVSYWESLDAILAWKNNIDHKKAKKKGRELWYRNYTIRIARVEQEYHFGL